MPPPAPPLLRRTVIVLGVVALAWSACTSGTSTQSSCGGQECQAGQVCFAGGCRDSCEMDLDCVEGEACVANVCMPPELIAEGSSSGAPTSASSSSTAQTGASSSAAAAASSSSSATTAGTPSSSSSAVASPTTSSSSSAVASSSSSTGGTASSAAAVTSSSSAVSSVGASSAATSSSSSAAGSSSPASSSSGGVDAGVGDAGNPCIPDTGCFTGNPLANGTCEWIYKCDVNSQFCVGNDFRCVTYDRPECRHWVVGQRMFLSCGGNWPSEGWGESHNFCRGNWEGWDLAVVTTAEEHEAINYYLSDVTADFWIGLTDRVSYNGENFSVEGTYVWVDGTPFSYGSPPGAAPWCADEPNPQNDEGEDCMEYKANGDCWNDDDCSDSNWILCGR